MPSPSAVVSVALRHAAARVPDVFAAGRRLVVGFSGGQDSTCLLHALASQQRGPEVVAAHVDHGLRPTSAADAERAVALARSMGTQAISRRVDVAAYRAAGRWSVQQAARAARYQALASVVAEVQAAALVVAHTADDQAESLLLHLVRGSGLGGLAGMRLDDTLATARLGPPVAESAAWRHSAGTLRVARPLLSVDRATTRAYCSEHELPFLLDPSNQSRAYTRNRVRLDLLPALERFNPAIRVVLARAADLAAEDLAALEALADAAFGELAIRAEPGSVRFSRQAWLGAGRAMQRRLLRRAVETLSGGLEDVPAGPIEDALDLMARAEPHRRYHLPRAVELVTLPDGYCIRRRAADVSLEDRNRRGGPPASV